MRYKVETEVAERTHLSPSCLRSAFTPGHSPSRAQHSLRSCCSPPTLHTFKARAPPPMASAFTRALSPAIAANTAAIIQGFAAAAPPEDAPSTANIVSATASFRHQTIAGAATIAEVSNHIPTPYRAALTTHLNTLERNLTRLASVRASVTKLARHEAAGTVPAQIRRDPPSLQQTAEFADSERGRAHKAVLQKLSDDFCTAALSAQLAAKKEEVSSLEASVDAQRVVPAMRKDVMDIAVEVFKTHCVPPVTLDGEGDHTMTPITPMEEWEVMPAAKVTRDSLLADCAAIYGHVRVLCELSLTRKALKDEKKKTTATAARTAAGDVGTSTIAGDVDGSAAIRQLVAAEVAKAIKSTPGPNKRKRESGEEATERKRKELKVPSTPSCLQMTKYYGSLGQVRPRTRGASLQQGAGASRSTRASQLNARERRRQGLKPGRPRRPTELQRRTSTSGQCSTARERAAEFAERGSGRRAQPRAEPASWPERVNSRSKNAARSTSRSVVTAKRTVSTGGCTTTVSRRSAHHNGKVMPSSSSSTNIFLDSDGNADLSRRNIRLFNRSNIGKPCEGDLWLANPLTMPDSLLTIPLPDAIHEILSRTSIATLSALSYGKEVHVSPGVHLPRDISFQLSVGAKYMLHQPAQVDLLERAWKDFNRRIRWKINFLFENEGTGEKPYDPDYDVRPSTSVQAPALPLYIEQGLARGRLFVYKTMAKIPKDEKDLANHHFKTLGPQIDSIRQFLLDNRYIITGTDKNLGIAVSERTWIVEKSQDILNNVNEYRQIELDEAVKILDEKCTLMRELAAIAKEHVDDLEGSVSDFLRSKVTLRGESHHIPKFYGIPKIHKEPVKMRPIIPCHSAIMNPAAKYVSKKLKPLIKEAATVIHGTKDLAIKLSSLSINTRRKWYIVTGDVVAFYPNIPLQRCIDIIQTMYSDFLLGTAIHADAVNPAIVQLFNLCLKVGNTRLLTQFQGKIYEQLNGLAMGVADSPDLANLYGYYFEWLAKILEHPNIFFYGRYIDDCLAIVYAESETAAVNLLRNLVQFENCVITWDCSDSHAPFLDMMLYKDANNTLQHMPYRKRRNHQERIPWISAHPYDVKRGTFLGEMSRLAVLSSKIEHYSEALKGLVTLYIQRGYPVGEVHKWLCSNVSRRWNDRLVDRQAQPKGSADVLVLKSQYNLAWNYFNATQLGDTIFNYWRTWLDRADAGLHDQEYPAPNPKDTRVAPWESGINVPGQWDVRKTSLFNSRVIVSRKRTRNMLDLTNLWKRSVIETHEDLVLDDLVGTAARYAASKRPDFHDINTAVAGPSLKRRREAEGLNQVEPDNELQPVRYQRSSPTPEGWRSGALGTWGRGSRL